MWQLELMADSSDVCPAEDALKAFLEYLVDPVLPAKPSIRDNSPSPSQHQLVAKQVYILILLFYSCTKINLGDLFGYLFKFFF